MTSTTTTKPLNLHRHAEVRLAATGERVFVVCEPDSDPSALVWVSFAVDPDRSVYVLRDALAAL